MPQLTRLYPKPLHLTAFELGLPVTGTLLPHCVLLIASHPIITPSFLENFELFDKHAHRTGLVRGDRCYLLNGTKSRNGPRKGQQIIPLNDETARIVLQIIVLTNPLRKYLRDRGDDSWRYLLLSCKSGFGYPTRIRNISTDTSDNHRLVSLANSLGNTCDLPYENCLEYVRRFSLSALRASAGVLIYLETRDARRMAEALGHSEYSPALLARYLPEPVLAFFQERWIRIFQSGIIVEALKDSKYLLEASSFSSMAQLDEFLKSHALKSLSKHLIESASPTSGYSDEKSSANEVVIGVSTGILTTLLSVRDAVFRAKSQPSGMAIYWAGIATYVADYIGSDSCKREDLKSYLTTATEKADPEKMESLIYA